MTLGEKLRVSREDKKLTQSDVASHLNISRQSISKWENNKGYPDLDNLILLSNLYEISIDKLLKENENLQQKINENNETIKEHKSKLNTLKHIHKSEKDEGLLLLIIAIAACAAAPLGLLIAPIVIIRNKKSNSFYILLNIVCILCFLISAYFLWISIGDRLDLGGRSEVTFTPE